MGEDCKPCPGVKDWLFPLYDPNWKRTRFGEETGCPVLCPLCSAMWSCSGAPRWHRGSKDMKRWLARVEHSERSTPAVRCRLCTSKPKLHIVLLACGWLSDAMLPCFRVKKHSAIFSFVYLKIITRKNIWRNVIFSSKKKKVLGKIHRLQNLAFTHTTKQTSTK